MNDEEHRALVELVAQGKVLIGVDRSMAREFYTFVPIETIERETGEAPYLDKLVVWFALLAAPASLAVGLVLGFVAFKWWGLIPAAVFPPMFFLQASLSSVGGARMAGISLLLLGSVCVHFVLDSPYATGIATLFMLSLWAVRLLYCSSTFFVRCFVIRNARAFEYLSGALSIVPVE